MANEHPDAPKQFGIRLSAETMELVSAIQEFRQRTNQPITLSAVVEDATTPGALNQLLKRRVAITAQLKILEEEHQAIGFGVRTPRGWG